MGEGIFGGDWDVWRSSSARNAGSQPVAEHAHEPIAVAPHSETDFIADLSAVLDALQTGYPATKDRHAEGNQGPADLSPAVGGDPAPLVTDHEEVVAIGGRAKGFDKNAVACGVVGFFAGALAWHLVGFWSFVSAIAFNGDVGSAPPVALARNSASQEVKTSDIVTGSITSSQIPTSADCVALAIDRHKRNFEKTACPQTSLPFRHNDQSEKGDRLTDATDVGHGDPPPEVPAASETDAGAPVNAPAVEGDFDLQLRPGP